MNETTKKYNGYTNYETWATALWISNEEETYHVCVNKSANTLKQFCLMSGWDEEAKSVIVKDISYTDLHLVNWDEVQEALAI